MGNAIDVMDRYKAYAAASAEEKSQKLTLTLTRGDFRAQIEPPDDPGLLACIIPNYGPGRYQWILRAGTRIVAQGYIETP